MQFAGFSFGGDAMSMPIHSHPRSANAFDHPNPPQNRSSILIPPAPPSARTLEQHPSAALHEHTAESRLPKPSAKTGTLRSIPSSGPYAHSASVRCRLRNRGPLVHLPGVWISPKLLDSPFDFFGLHDLL